MMRRSLVAAALAGAAVSACDVPTEPPMWEQTWVVPGEAIELSVAELLPAGVAINDDTTAFVTDVPGTGLTFSIQQLCGATCDPIYNTPGVPKPPFDETLATTTSLPADLESAVLAGGSFDVTMAHSFQFDPLRPTSDPTGWTGFIVVRVTSNGEVVAEDSISGADTAFPSTSPLTPSLQIQPVTVTNDLQVEVRIFSPDGDATTVESDDSLSVTVGTATVEISEATVAASTITLDPTTTEMDFSGIAEDGAVLDRIQSGALRFQVDNPFTVTGAVGLTFQLSGTDIQRSLSIDQGTYGSRFDFTGEELRQILSEDVVNVSASGSVTPTAGTVTVRPDQELVLENEFEVVLLIGGSDEEV